MTTILNYIIAYLSIFYCVLFIIIFFRLEKLFNDYKELKMKMDKNFDSKKYQENLGGTMVIHPVFITENESNNPAIDDLKNKYNRFLKKGILFVVGGILFLILLWVINGRPISIKL